MKKNNLLKCLCFGLLALLVGVFALIPKSSVKTAGAEWNSGGSNSYYNIGNYPSVVYGGKNNEDFSFSNGSVVLGSSSSSEYSETQAYYSLNAGQQTCNFDLTTNMDLVYIQDILKLPITNQSDLDEYTRNYYSFFQTYISNYRSFYLMLNLAGMYDESAEVVSSSAKTLTINYNGITKSYSLVGNSVPSFIIYFNNGNSSSTGLPTGIAYDFSINDLYDFVKNASFSYSFNLRASCNVSVYTQLCCSFNSIGQTSLDNMLYGDSMLPAPPYYDDGYSSVNIYYYGVYSQTGGYYNTYWNEFYKNKYDNELNSAEDNAFNRGYNEGFSEGSDSASELPSTVIAFASLPFSILGGFLDFDLFGFNIYNVILALVTVFLCIWIIKKIK